MEEKLDRIEKKIKDLAGVIGTLGEKTSHIEGTVDVLARSVAEGFKRMDTEFEKVRGEMGEGFEGVNGKLAGLNRRIDNELEQRKQLEDRVSKVEVVVFPASAK